MKSSGCMCAMRVGLHAETKGKHFCMEAKPRKLTPRITHLTPEPDRSRA